MRWDSPFSEGEKDFCPGIIRADRQGFKLESKGERDKTRHVSDKLRDGVPELEGLCASEVFQASPLSAACNEMHL